MSVTSGSDERMVGSGVDSSSIDDDNSGEKTTGGNGSLKKGPWTSAEDAILVDYVTKHGEGNWNAVQKHSGLARCGKSCRLRWANHLRPNLKKGSFTPEEERRIIELHAKMGNKWARMATELPGRTDNEIKNYWNTRIKRQQRAGQPIYPPDICLEALNENQQSDSANAFSSHDVHHPDFIPVNDFEIPTVEFKTLELDRPIFRHPMPNIPTGKLLADGFNSSNLNRPFLRAAQPSSKRLRGSEPPFPCLEGITANTFISENQFNSSPLQIELPCSFSSPYHHSSTSNLLNDGHAILNGNPSSEPHDWAMKQELPSLQTEVGSWCSHAPSSPMPSFESVDSLIHTPPAEHNQLCNLSPQNSGLLDAVLYESKAFKNSSTNSYLHSSYPSDVMPNATYDLHEPDWEAYEDELSPLGHSTSSVFSESTPVSGNSFDEPVTFPASQIFARPDFLLASNCDGCGPSDEDHSLKDVVGMFLVDDCRPEMDVGATQSSHCDANLWNAAMSTR